jgi:hypothetical protein
MLVGLLLVCFKSGNVTSSLSPLAIDPDLRQLVYPWKKTKGTKGYDQSKKLCRTVMFLAQWNAWIRNWYGRRNGGSLFIPSLLFLSLCASPNGGYLCVNVNSNLLSTKEKEREKVAQLVQRVWTHFVADVWPLCSTCWGLAAGALHCIVLHTISVFFVLTECSSAGSPCSHQVEDLLSQSPGFAIRRHLLGSKAVGVPWRYGRSQ